MYTRILLVFWFLCKNIFSILVYGVVVFTCLHCKDSGGILVDCSIQILVSKL